MNRFRSKKKNNESVGSTRTPSLENEIPPLPNLSSRSKTFRRNKKGGPPPKPEEPGVDIAAALPSSDDFRTSLLMPNLSARFSMLREQDDPSSKIGKANDDSVLFPKRASRLDLFNHQGLSEIAEVDSRRGSLHPPFAYRTESYSTDGYGTDNDASRNGSIMSRAKPGEGNTMFGGRQKVYKIPLADRGAERANGGDWYSGTNIATKGMGGKALYESDVASSAFQRLREQEREKNEHERNARPSTSSSKEAERAVTPPSGHYNRNRETTSSTNSGPSYPRTSTAATSVASQKSVYGVPTATNGMSTPVTSPIPSTSNFSSSDRPGHSGPKAKRLYGQGLDQHMHEQQSSALHRLESLHRQRTISPPLPRHLHQSRSATNLQERYQRGGPLHAPNDFRVGSPPPASSPSRMADFDLGLNEESQSPTAEKNDSGYGRSPPLSPLGSPEDPTLIAALEPNDIGKATASGAFNKPKKQYDEQQYLQRQMQLQQGRQTPPPGRPFSPNATSINEQVTGRTRNNSSVSTQSMGSSLRRPYDQIEHHNHEYSLNTVPEVQSPRKRNSSRTSQNDANTSFLNEFSGSEVSLQSDNEMDPGSPVAASQYQSPSTAVVDVPIIQRSLAPEHSVRYQPERLPTTLSDETISDTLSQRTITHSKKSSISTTKPDLLDLDSPTLGPTNGLSGLVRTHLRNESNQSSIYPDQSPGLLSKFPNELQNGHPESSSEPHTFFNSGGMSDDEQEGQSYQLSKADHAEAVPSPLAVTARSFLEHATALRQQESLKPKQLLGNNKAQRILGREAPRSSDESANVPSWQEQLRAHHARGGSTETEKEREAFATELAERRRMVQDNLKSFVESESRSASPGPGTRSRDDSPAKHGKSFGLLRAKNSGSSLVSKNEQPSKAMKMLGINPGSNLANSSSHPSMENFFAEEGEQRSRYMNDGQRAQMPPRRQAKTSSQKSSPPLPTSRVTRSSSEISERLPEYRNGRQREPNVLGPYVPQMINPPSNFAGGPPRQVKNAVLHYPQGPTERSQSAMSGRVRSNSRTNATSYFENRGAATGPAAVPSSSDSSQRPSPITPTYSSHSAPATRETPPSSANFASPIMITSPQSTHSYNRRPTYRKGSVNKHDISEPHFLSSTSSVNTVDLPRGASLSNGMEPPPPVPPQNPRRRRTETLLQALGRLEKIDSAPPVLASVNAYEERGTFSADEGDGKSKSFRRHKLRKSSSEGGTLNAKARQQAMMGPNPAMPRYPPDMAAAPSSSVRQFPSDNSSTSSPGMRFRNNGQFGPGGSSTNSPMSRQHPAFSTAPSPATHHHFPPSDVPASAVMF